MRAAEPAGPIEDRELPSLFRPIANAERFALAVSGGTDSLALLDCVDRWRRTHSPRAKITVLTVDHGLRPSSKADAARVIAIARGRGLPAKTLRWTGEKPRGDVEAAARAARYRLLLDAANGSGASHLVLAHHRDDQAETLLLRLARGSGVFGLAAMRAEITAGDAIIFRPFLDVAKARLAETIAVAGLTPVEDAMNVDPRFARARLRRIMPLLAADGIDPAGLARTTRRLAGAAEAIELAADAHLNSAVRVDDLAIVSIDAPSFFSAPNEVCLRALVRVLLAIGGDDYPPRFDRLSRLAADMRHHIVAKRFKRTLAGSVVEWRRGGFVVYREVGRTGLSAFEVGSGFSGPWDHRFHVEIGTRAPAGLKLGALSETGRRAIGVRAGSAPPGALAALPALWRGNTVKAVPSLGYFDGGGRNFRVSARPIVPDRLAKAPKFPDFLTAP